MSTSSRNNFQTARNRIPVQGEDRGEHATMRKVKKRTKKKAWKSFFHLSTPGTLSVVNEQSGKVYCEFVADEGLRPTCGQIYGDPELLIAAYNQEHAKLAILGSECRVHIIGITRSLSKIIVESAPVFRALAKLVKTAA